MNDDTEVIDQTIVEDPKEMLRQARELIPVGKHGAGPLNRAQQVDYAQDMAKARFLIPKFLQNNIGDCLGLVEIATASGLVPYLLAKMCYLEAGSGQVALMSQAYHALVVNHLKGDLEVQYEGTGEDRVCIITGYLKHAPEKPRVHRSPPLKQVHPGHTRKDGKDWVKGSPLWDRKPDVQLFYDTSRDWVRIYCPRATMGLYTGEELREYGPEFARDVTPPPGVAERLKESGHGREEGPQGHEQVEAAIASAKADKPKEEPATKPKGKPGRPKKAAESKPSPEAATPPPPADDAPPPSADTAPAQPHEPDPPPGIADHFQTEAADFPTVPQDTQTTTPPPKPEPKPEPKKTEPPKTPEQWKDYCLGWLKDLTSVPEIRQRWNQERGLRNSCGVIEEQRAPVMLAMQERCDELAKG
jgi:hypothetical protein